MASITHYAQLNIGRNVGNEPMSDWLWEWFQDGAANALMGATHVATGARTAVERGDIQTHLGRGEWDGITEDSAHVSLFWADGMDVDYIRTTAASLAQMFGQDAIAVIVGSELVTA